MEGKVLDLPIRSIFQPSLITKRCGQNEFRQEGGRFSLRGRVRSQDIWGRLQSGCSFLLKDDKLRCLLDASLRSSSGAFYWEETPW